MKYLIFSSPTSAQSRNHQIALEQGCGEYDTTQYWFKMIEHPDGRAALCIEDNNVITSQEILELKEEQYMRDEGWLNELVEE